MTKQALVLQAFRTEIMGGQLQPGTRLVIDEIAQRLQELHDGMIAAAGQGNDDRWIALNAGFHAAVPALANLPRAREMISRASTEWERLRRLRFQGVPRPDPAQAQAEHAQMITALGRRDLAALETLARDHNRHEYTHYLGQVGRQTPTGI